MQARGPDAGDPLRDLEGFDERVGRSREDVRFPRDALLHREEMAARGVVDVSPAVGRFFRQRSQATPQISEEEGPDLTRVSGTVGDPRFDDDEGQALADHGLRDFVMGGPFRLIVFGQPGTLPIGPDGFVDQLTVGIREDREGARVDAFADSQLLHRSEHIPRPFDVDLLGLGAVPRADLVPPCDMEDAVDSHHGAPYRLGDRHVAGADLHPEGPEVSGPRRIASDRNHLVSIGDQCAGDPATDESRGAGHEILRPDPSVPRRTARGILENRAGSRLWERRASQPCLRLHGSSATRIRAH